MFCGALQGVALNWAPCKAPQVLLIHFVAIHCPGPLLFLRTPLFNTKHFVAFGTLGSYISDSILSERGMIISTYALCGFANFSSIGIQLGGISALAPERKSDLARIGLRAMFGGAIASWLTATIAGILI